MYTKIFGALIIAVVLLVAFIVNMTWRRGVSSTTSRLGKLIAQRSDYQIFVGVPFANPKEWAVATPQGTDSLSVKGYGSLPVSDVRAFAVAYANGQLVDLESCGLPLPQGLKGLFPSSRRDSDILHLDDLKPGEAYIQITYEPSVTRPRNRNYYATTLKNISTERIRVHRFAGYKRNGEGWKLSTVTRQFYSAEEFREWYGLGSGNWIEPGQAVTDHNNYGSPPVLWAYYCESASGRQFITGGVLE